MPYDKNLDLTTFLPHWEQTTLTVVLLAGMASVLLTAILLLLLALFKSEHQEKAFFIGFSAFPASLVIWGLLVILFDAATIGGWGVGILVLITFLSMSVALWVIPLKVLLLIEKHHTMHKASIWALMVIWPVIIVIGAGVIFKLLVGS